MTGASLLRSCADVRGASSHDQHGQHDPAEHSIHDVLVIVTMQARPAGIARSRIRSLLCAGPRTGSAMRSPR